LPNTVILPSVVNISHNTILIVTSRGNVFSFQWPFQIPTGGQTQAAFSAGMMKIAYQYTTGGTGTQGYDSMNEKGPVDAHSGGTWVSGTYCHTEPSQNPPYYYPTGPSYAEELTPIPGVRNSVLWFVAPWVTRSIFTSAQTNGAYVNGHPSNITALFLYVNITNTGDQPFAINGGSVDLTWYSFNWLTATLIGYYEGVPGTYYSAGSPHTVLGGHSFYGVFKVNSLCLGKSTCDPNSSSTGTWPPPTGQSVMFLGSASLTSNTGNETFVAGVALTSGLWVRASC